MLKNNDVSKLYQLIDLYLAKRINETEFCDKFFDIYDIIMNINDLNDIEKKVFDNLNKLVGDFLEYKDKYPHIINYGLKQKKATVAICMTDLAEGYKHKFTSTYEPEFILQCCNRALEAFPDYINALLLKAETLFEMFTKTNNEDYYRKAENLYSHIHQLGYRKMPEKMYLEWLQSIKKHPDTHHQ